MLFAHIAEHDLDVVADYLVSLQPLPHLIAFTGDLGAGKTTLIKKIVAKLGSEDVVSSPTFSLINEYRVNNGGIIYHSDWYRVKDIQELYDAGMEEYIDDVHAMFLLEWPAVGMDMLNGIPFTSVTISHKEGYRDYLIKNENANFARTP